MAEAPHDPVMVREVIGFLGGRGTVVDMTLGAGGHAEALLAAGVSRLVGIDRDPTALALAGERLAVFGGRFQPVRARFSEVDEEVVVGPVDGVLFDLGVSSMQLDRPERGFSYREDGPLDMRMGDEGPTAADLVNALPEGELADVIFEYGQEPKSRRIAAAIVRARSRAPIAGTDELAGIVVSAVGRRPGGPHPARRTFQALRIAVNREIEELAASLPQAVDLLAPGGRVVVIAYHSLEDRIAKQTFRADGRLAILTKKPLRPSATEIETNPRARSAKLRAAERVEEAA
ncbi:MAG: 16S rRNA (cytosine(1402)-N(4))-methyltransferase RsmH [Actinomycetota bacterium]